MNLFRNYIFSWWQAGLLKVCMLCFGIAIGVTWPWVFIDYVTTFVVVGVAIGIYLAFVSFRK